MRKITQAVAKRMTRKNAKWFLKTNLASWVIQGTLYGILVVVGVGSVGALVSAKCTAYVVWIGQCIQAARAD